jgi:hypothetical protein
MKVPKMKRRGWKRKKARGFSTKEPTREGIPKTMGPTTVEELPLLHTKADEYDTKIGHVRKCKGQCELIHE